MTSQATTSSGATPSSSARNAAKPPASTGPDAPHRGEVLLGVELEALAVDVAVEVDGELGDPQQRPVEVRTGALELAVDPDDDPARQAEVAVEPGVEQGAAVDLDAELPPPGQPVSGRGLIRRLGESVWAPTRRNRRRARGAVGHRPGHQRAAAGHE